MNLGAGVGQAIAELQARPALAAFAVALEGRDGDMGNVFGNRHDVDGAIPKQGGDA